MRELIKSHVVDVVFLFETLVNTNKIDFLRRKLGFADAFAMDCTGHSGGVAVLWRNSNSISVSNFNNNFITVKVIENNVAVWRLSSFYSYPERSRQKASWDLLRSLSISSMLPWCCIGDYNDLLSSDEKKGRVPHPEWCLRGFRETVLDCDLHDITMDGYQYTRSRSKGTERAVEERLDRAMGTTHWFAIFPFARVQNLVADISDHSPILLVTDHVEERKVGRRFYFENKWLTEPDLAAVVQYSWDRNPNGGLLYKLSCVATDLAVWGRNLSLKFRDYINKCKGELESLRRWDNPVSVDLYKNTQAKLSKLLADEKTFWSQRSKSFWLKGGDLNTRYFHASATIRKSKNKIKKLKDDDGITFIEVHDFCRIAFSYFNNMFTPSSDIDYDPVISNISRKTNNSDNFMLLAPFTTDEFKAAAFSMHSEKSLGPDGLNPGFYRRFWNLLGGDIFKECMSWVESGNFPEMLMTLTWF